MVLDSHALAALVRACAGPEAPITLVDGRGLVPRIVCPEAALERLGLDRRRRRLLAWVDGEHTIAEIVHACGMLDALDLLVELAASGIVAIG